MCDLRLQMLDGSATMEFHPPLAVIDLLYNKFKGKACPQTVTFITQWITFQGFWFQAFQACQRF